MKPRRLHSDTIFSMSGVSLAGVDIKKGGEGAAPGRRLKQ
jgi:hypothetical protein